MLWQPALERGDGAIPYRSLLSRQACTSTATDREASYRLVVYRTGWLGRRLDAERLRGRGWRPRLPPPLLMRSACERPISDSGGGRCPVASTGVGHAVTHRIKSSTITSPVP